MLLLVLVAVAVAVASAAASASASASAAPHIITIILDDVGWNDVGWRGGPMPTPAIDALSARGVRLERHYVHPVCTPSRMSLMTGKYSHLSGWPSASIIIGPAPFTLPAGTRTLPKELRARGYAVRSDYCMALIGIVSVFSGHFARFSLCVSS